MGIAYSEFIRMTWSQFVLYYHGWSKESFRQRFEGARLVAYTVAAVNSAKGFAKSPEKWMPFPTDEKPERSEDWARLMRAKMRLAAEEHKRKYNG